MTTVLQKCTICFWYLVSALCILLKLLLLLWTAATAALFPAMQIAASSFAVSLRSTTLSTLSHAHSIRWLKGNEQAHVHEHVQACKDCEPDQDKGLVLLLMQTTSDLWWLKWYHYNFVQCNHHALAYTAYFPAQMCICSATTHFQWPTPWTCHPALLM